MAEFDARWKCNPNLNLLLISNSNVTCIYASTCVPSHICTCEKIQEMSTITSQQEQVEPFCDELVCSLHVCVRSDFRHHQKHRGEVNQQHQHGPSWGGPDWPSIWPPNFVVQATVEGQIEYSSVCNYNWGKCFNFSRNFSNLHLNGKLANNYAKWFNCIRCQQTLKAVEK